MKKILSLVLAIVFMLALAIPAFAAGNVAYDDATDEVEATYNVAESYVVMIPSEITFEDGVANNTFSVANVLIRYGKVLKVTIASANQFKLVNEESQELAYKLTSTVESESPVVINSGTSEETALITVSAGTLFADDKEATLAFEITGDLKYMGEYKDTLTFTVTTDTNS